MKRNKLLVMVMASLWPWVAVAQQERPEPGTVQMPVQKEAPLSKREIAAEEKIEDKAARGKNGFVRIWQFARLGTQRLTASLKKADGTEIILGRSMPYARMISYQRLPVGKYRLSVRESNPAIEQAPPEANSTLAVTLKPELPLSGLEIEITDKTYSTILLQTEGEKTSAKFLTVDPSSAADRKIRVISFVPEKKASVLWLRNGQDQVLFPEVTGTMQDKVMSGLAGPTTFVAAFPLPNGNISRQSIEVDFASTQVASLVIHLDRYDRLTVSSSEDLPVGAQAPAGAP